MKLNHSFISVMLFLLALPIWAAGDFIVVVDTSEYMLTYKKKMYSLIDDIINKQLAVGESLHVITFGKKEPEYEFKISRRISNERIIFSQFLDNIYVTTENHLKKEDYDLDIVPILQYVYKYTETIALHSRKRIAFFCYNPITYNIKTDDLEAKTAYIERLYL